MAKGSTNSWGPAEREAARACPCCGQRVEVVSDGDGTSHYAGVAEREVDSARRVVASLVEAQGGEIRVPLTILERLPRLPALSRHRNRRTGEEIFRVPLPPAPLVDRDTGDEG